MPKIETPAGPVSTVFDGPEDARCLLVVGHGAGGNLHTEFLDHFALGAAGAGLRVCRFNFAFSEAGRRSPDRQPALEDTFDAVVESVASSAPGTVILGGKSMGGRIASHVVARGTKADGLVFLGYPLHPPGKPERIRDAHLHDITVPMLFVEGTRDPFCPLPTLEKVRADLAAPTEVVVIEDGDHSFKVRKSSGRSTAAAWDEVVTAVTGWADRLSG